mmetsp:Transcript_24605/g.71159  ORF Transcript_24605/g.71159 Transcript_24605/m.71159 type:complete len:442 (-) Transcript_24605:105-1430(-)
MAENMVGPVMRVLMQHFAAQNAAVDHQVAAFAAPAADAGGPGSDGRTSPAAAAAAAPEAEPAEGTDLAVALEADLSSMPTPVVRFGSQDANRQGTTLPLPVGRPAAFVSAPPWLDDDDEDEDVAAQIAGRRGARRGPIPQDPDPPELEDDDFALPPPAIDLAAGFAQFWPLSRAATGAAHHADNDGVAAQAPPAAVAAAAAALAAAAGTLGVAGAARSDGESTPDMPWTAPHTHRGSQPSTPSEGRAQTEAPIADEVPAPPAALAPAIFAAVAFAAEEHEGEDDEDEDEAAAKRSAAAPTPRPPGAAKLPPRVIGERALQLVADLEVFHAHELLKAMIQVWGIAVRTLRLQRRAEVAAAFGLALGPAATPTAPPKRAAPTQTAGWPPLGTNRVPPIGCCQAVRVGRRRIAAQRAPRTAVVPPGGRRIPPCGGAAAAVTLRR